jgi:ParB family chromosome partitioning protein
MTQERISERVGKSRTSITNYLRLLKLPAQIQMALKNKEMDMGHARALLSLESPSAQLKLFKEIQRNGYSVRKVEEMVQMLKNGVEGADTKRTGSATAKLSSEYDALRQRLADFFQAKVQITCSPKGKGKISIPFNSEDELELIMNLLDQRRQGD